MCVPQGLWHTPRGSLCLITWTLPWTDPTMPAGFKYSARNADNTQANSVCRASQTGRTLPRAVWSGGWCCRDSEETLQAPFGSIDTVPTAAPRERHPRVAMSPCCNAHLALHFFFFCHGNNQAASEFAEAKLGLVCNQQQEMAERVTQLCPGVSSCWELCA